MRSSCEAWCTMAAVLALSKLALNAFLDVVRRDWSRSGKVESAPGSKESSQPRSFPERGLYVLWKVVVEVAAPVRQLLFHCWCGCLHAVISSKAGGAKSGNSWRGFAKGRLTSGPRCHSGKVLWKNKENSMLAISQKIYDVLLKDFVS